MNREPIHVPWRHKNEGVDVWGPEYPVLWAIMTDPLSTTEALRELLLHSTAKIVKPSV